jgi:hypothetical protein
MATGHSTRRRPSSRVRSNSKSHPTPTTPVPKKATSVRSAQTAAPKRKGKTAGPPHCDEILCRFTETLALVETGYAVLDVAQQDWEGQDAQLGCPAVHTLSSSIKALARVYSEVDVAFMALS